MHLKTPNLGTKTQFMVVNTWSKCCTVTKAVSAFLNIEIFMSCTLSGICSQLIWGVGIELEWHDVKSILSSWSQVGSFFKPTFSLREHAHITFTAISLFFESPSLILFHFHSCCVPLSSLFPLLSPSLYVLCAQSVCSGWRRP
jgi:hypothetical protein